MKPTIDMNVSPNGAAQFKAYLAFVEYVESNWDGETVSYNMIINEIVYVKPSKGRPAKWLFKGTMEARRFQHGPYGSFGWYREPDSVFEKYMSATEVAAFMARKFGNRK